MRKTRLWKHAYTKLCNDPKPCFSGWLLFPTFIESKTNFIISIAETISELVSINQIGSKTWVRKGRLRNKKSKRPPCVFGITTIYICGFLEGEGAQWSLYGFFKMFSQFSGQIGQTKSLPPPFGKSVLTW